MRTGCSSSAGCTTARRPPRRCSDSLPSGGWPGRRSASSAGLGYKIQEAEGVFDVTGVFSGMLILATVVIIVDSLVTLVERRLLVWRPGQVTHTAQG